MDKWAVILRGSLDLAVAREAGLTPGEERTVIVEAEDELRARLAAWPHKRWGEAVAYYSAHGRSLQPRQVDDNTELTPKEVLNA